MKCQICSGEKLYLVLSLGHQPPAGSFLRKEQLNEPETNYPLDVYFCEECCLVQLGYAVDPEILFREYVYNTETNQSLVMNFRRLANFLMEKFSLSSDDLVVDIGSNDGTLLEQFLHKKIKVLGIEPSTVADLAIKKKIPTIKEFFDKNIAENIVKEHGKAKIITAMNVFAHVKELKSFVKGVKEMLDEKGAFVTESHYLMNMITKLQYDSVYHEHLRYYSLRPLRYLLNEVGMELYDAENIETHGGSIRVYACIKGRYKVTDRVNEMLKSEEKEGLYDKHTYDYFRKKVVNLKFELQDMLRKLKKEGKRVVGVGAPAKGNTLLNYCNIGQDVLNYITERSYLKVGKFTPGMHIPVVSEARLVSDQPNYALLLSWNLKDIIIDKLRKAGYKGKFIIPNPELKLVQ